MRKKSLKIPKKVFVSKYANFVEQEFGPNKTQLIVFHSLTKDTFRISKDTRDFLLAIRASTFISGKNFIDLISEDSSLTELTQRKYFQSDGATPILRDNEFWNLYQIQNTYKQGEVVNLSLFDNQFSAHFKKDGL